VPRTPAPSRPAGLTWSLPRVPARSRQPG